MDYKDMLAETLRAQAEGQFEQHRYEGREAKRKHGRVAKGAPKRRVTATTKVKVLLAQGSAARKSGKTGRNEWGRKAEEERARRQQLRKIRTDRITSIVGADAIDLLIKAGLRNIWALANAEQGVILNAGLQDRHLVTIRKYLTMNGIPVKWKP